MDPLTTPPHGGPGPCPALHWRLGAGLCPRQHGAQHREAAGQCWGVDEIRMNTTGGDRVCLTPVSPALSIGHGVEKMLNRRYVEKRRPKVKSLRYEDKSAW